MKKLFLLGIIAVLTMGAVKAQNALPASESQLVGRRVEMGPKIQFTETEHDYGFIRKGSDGVYKFEFKNTGGKDLVLSEVKSSVPGCTILRYPKGAVKPGQTNVIVVKYNTNMVGEFNATVVVKCNAADSKAIKLKIKGVVEDR